MSIDGDGKPVAVEIHEPAQLLAPRWRTAIRPHETNRHARSRDISYRRRSPRFPLRGVQPCRVLLISFRYVREATTHESSNFAEIRRRNTPKAFRSMTSFSEPASRAPK